MVVVVLHLQNKDECAIFQTKEPLKISQTVQHLISVTATWSHGQNGTELTVLKICRPSWPPDTKMRPSNMVTPAALRLALISVTTVHLLRRDPKHEATSLLGPTVPFGIQEVSGCGETHLSVSGE